MRAEFTRAPDGDVVGSAAWEHHRVVIDAPDEAAAASLRRVFRPIPVAVDDPARRSFGTRGPVVLQPGTSGWFQAAARARGEEEGLHVRFVPGAEGAPGWDPAGAYRPFLQSVARTTEGEGSR